MRCSYRCNMWCNCKKPTKKEPTPEPSSFENKVFGQYDPITENYLMTLFSNNIDEDNTINIEVDTETETGDFRVVIWEFWFIKNEEVNGLWREMRESLDTENVKTLFNAVELEGTNIIPGEFTGAAMAQFNAFLNNPTEEQTEMLKAFLEGEEEPPVIVEWGTIKELKDDLLSLSMEVVKHLVRDPWEEEGDGDILINGKTYTFEAISEDAADVFVKYEGYWWQTTVTIETDTETGEEFFVVGVIEEAPDRD